MARKPAQFYVYELVKPDGSIAYVGKGSGRRLSVQKRRLALCGHEVARFWSEADAYAFEVRRIAEALPELNRHPGGNGSKARTSRRGNGRASKLDLLIREIGSRRYAAHLVLAFSRAFRVDLSKVDRIRQVAYGPRV